MPADFYDTEGKGSIERLLTRLLFALDISENIHRMQAGLGGIKNGVTSLMLIPIALLAAVALFTVAYYGDLDSSWTAVEPLANDVVVMLGSSAIAFAAGTLAQVIPLSLTLMPSAIEMLGARFARFGSMVWQALVWFFVVFDLVTDVPRATAWVHDTWPYHSITENLSLFGALFSFNLNTVSAYIGYKVYWLSILLGFSYFAELGLLCTVYALVALIWKSLGWWGFMWYHTFFGTGKGNFSGNFGDRFDEWEEDPDEPRVARRAQRSGKQQKRQPEVVFE